MAERNLAKEIDSLKDDLGHVRTDLGSLIDSIKKLTKSKAKETTGTVQDELEKAFDELRDRSRGYVSAAERDIGERPLTSVLASFGIGLLVGKLLDR